MADRLSLANALTEAKIDRSAAERIATEILDAIHDSVATKADLERLEGVTRNELERLEAVTRSEITALRSEMSLRFAELEHRLTVRFASVMVVLIGLLFGALRYLPPAH